MSEMMSCVPTLTLLLNTHRLLSCLQGRCLNIIQSLEPMLVQDLLARRRIAQRRIEEIQSDLPRLDGCSRKTRHNITIYSEAGLSSEHFRCQARILPTTENLESLDMACTAFLKMRAHFEIVSV